MTKHKNLPKSTAINQTQPKSTNISKNPCFNPGGGLLQNNKNIPNSAKIYQRQPKSTKLICTLKQHIQTINTQTNNNITQKIDPRFNPGEGLMPISKNLPKSTAINQNQPTSKQINTNPCFCPGGGLIQLNKNQSK